MEGYIWYCRRSALPLACPAGTATALGVSLAGPPMAGTPVAVNPPGRCPGGFTWDGTGCVLAGLTTSVAA